ncbi:MAG: TAXI family TRAP transporter solute-binding subunit [Desulfomonile tiedjei]|uniref:TAXI family TRAP transporter solute-binding subunit n=1 Tax=Desulfomonile tiedjei TaxID=2358 RepID=A0A9D6V5P7_9BACT|nr:TAXI family TRAP transporter solute-binding subunit [Desulfomonile tiedjei]
MKTMRNVLSIMLSVTLALGNIAYFGDLADAASRGSSGSRSSGFGKSAPWSPPTHKAWNRSGGGIFEGSSGQSSGYAKPSPQQIPSGGYKKPGPGSPAGPSGYSKPSLGAQPSQDTAGQSGGYSRYTKPSLGRQPAPEGTQSGGYSKPSPTDSGQARKVQGPPSSGGYAKPSAAAGEGRFSGGTKFDKSTVNQLNKKKSQESLERYKSEQTKFKNPAYTADGVESNPLYQKGKNYSGFDYGTHYSNRDNYYRQQNWQPPAYAFGGSPSYGIFSSLFLFWMLDHVSNKNVAATAYNHSNDPGFQKWRQEAEAQAKNNTELKTKLDEMDKQIKAMQGTPKDPSYLPPGVPTEVALAENVLAAKKPEKPPLRFATGQTGGWYDKYGALFKQDAPSIDVKTITTTGSLENLKLLSEGQADMAIVQSDVLAIADKKLSGKDLITEQSSLYVEYAQLLANRDSGIKSVQDIDPAKNFVYVGPKGSGTALTWEALGVLYDKYKKIPVKYSDYASGLSDVEKNPKALMLFVGGLNSEFLKKAEEAAKKSGKLRLVTLDDRHFVGKVDKHGNAIYKFMQIPSNVYPDLQKGWFFSGDVETLAVQAVLVLRSEWAQKYGPEAMDALSKVVLVTKPEIQKLVNKTWK